MTNPSIPLLGHGSVGALPTYPLLWRVGAVFVAGGMLAGAFGAHGLKSRPGMTSDKINSFSTGVQYAVNFLQIFNGLSLLLVSYHPRFAVHRFVGPVVAIGGLMFSGSVFALVLNHNCFKAIGLLKPLGGLLMIAG
ncbi:hypothetical protein FA95DRAFT_1552275 [Auriscalpium vulgare]|uniref:Uncharacterized protein n=1 Tax=Auriscalpium vulgare TaxID=40419 RepID=A0ACB8SCY5_9AGAM|nr:hypothetical protein FA95DRAFT_1552275 [Auriscalpium vulgare]